MQLEGVKSNRDGIGTKIEVYTDTLYQMHYTLCGSGFLGQNTSYKHFGIGDREQIDSIIFTWSSGHMDRVYNLPANQIYYIKEGESTDGVIMVEEDIFIKERPISTTTSFSTSLKNSVQLFPNPTHRWLIIDSDYPFVRVVIKDSTGRLIDDKMVASKVSYTKDISTLPKGIYLVQIWWSSDRYITKKWLKQ